MSSIAVVGGGIIGLSVAYSLKQRGEEVVIYEKGLPGQGQSIGETRIFRHAHDDPRLITLAQESRELYKKWESDFNKVFLPSNGVVAIGSRAKNRHPYLSEKRLSQEISTSVAKRIMPIGNLPEPIFFDPTGGPIWINEVIQTLTKYLNKSIRWSEISEITNASGSVGLYGSHGFSEHDKVIVCAGIGSKAFAEKIGIDLPLQIDDHLRASFKHTLDIPSDQFACFQDSSGRFGEQAVYGSPLPNNQGYALGISNPPDQDSIGSLEGLQSRISTYVEKAFPALNPNPFKVVTCSTTQLPWSSDGLALYQKENIFLLAGHNLFKLAPALGEIIAQAAMGQEMDQRLLPESKLGQP